MDHRRRTVLDPWIQESILWRVRSGFYTSDEIVEYAADSLMLSSRDITSTQAKRIVRPAVVTEWRAQMERQQEWPDGPTVSDKVTAAFSSLERNHKILARMNFTCCNTCGLEEISEDRDDDTRGCVFFHEQSTESVVDNGDLYLAFGSFTKSERKNLAIGDTVVRSLRRAGLRVRWERDVKTKILVCCRQWRRRFQEDEDLHDVEDDDFDSADMSSGESEVVSEPGFSDIEDLEDDFPISDDLLTDGDENNPNIVE